MSKDIRFQIQEMVSSLIPLDSLEKEHIAVTRDWLASGSEIFRMEKPATPATHLYRT